MDSKSSYLAALVAAVEEEFCIYCTDCVDSATKVAKATYESTGYQDIFDHDYIRMDFAAIAKISHSGLRVAFSYSALAIEPFHRWPIIYQKINPLH